MRIEIKSVVNGFLVEVEGDCERETFSGHGASILSDLFSIRTTRQKTQYIAKTGDEVQAVLKTLFLEKETVKA
jgi:hypothetical protein